MNFSLHFLFLFKKSLLFFLLDNIVLLQTITLPFQQQLLLYFILRLVGYVSAFIPTANWLSYQMLTSYAVNIPPEYPRSIPKLSRCQALEELPQLTAPAFATLPCHPCVSV